VCPRTVGPRSSGAPAYFTAHAKPKSPRDLTNHRCINFRHGADVYRWEFEKGKKSLSVGVSGPLIVDDVGLVIRAAMDGVGIAFLAEEQAATTPRARIARTRARRLVPTLHRLLPLLLRQKTTTSSTRSSHQHPQTINDKRSPLAPVDQRAATQAITRVKATVVRG